MRNWNISDIRWASEGELGLPLWKDWNRKHLLPRGAWRQAWAGPYLASRIPRSGQALDAGAEQTAAGTAALSSADSATDYAFSISPAPSGVDAVSAVREVIRVARHRAVITLEVSESSGCSTTELMKVAAFLGVDLPRVPIDVLRSNSPALRPFGQAQAGAASDMRVLAFTIDALDGPPTVAILIPHWESWPFLKQCLASILRQETPAVAQRVIVLDDLSQDGSFEKGQKEFGADVEFVRITRPNKKTEPDVGLLLDEGLKLVREQYVATIDADLFPISKSWLSFPIWMTERHNLSSIGIDTALSPVYCGLFPEYFRNDWNGGTGYAPGAALFDNERFTITNNFYRVMRTATMKVVSEGIGYTKATQHTGPRAGYRFFERVSLMKRPPGSRLWNYFGRKIVSFYRTRLNPRFPYLPGNCDNGVAASHFLDVNRMGPKFIIPLTGYVARTPTDGVFGQNLCDLVFHFALSTRALSKERREIADAGPEYTRWIERIGDGTDVAQNTWDDLVTESRRSGKPPWSETQSEAWWLEQKAVVTDLIREHQKSPMHRS